MSRFVDVALHLPLDRLFTYEVPSALEGRLRPGQRVRVPFRHRVVPGTCVALRGSAPDFPCKPVSALLEEEPVFSPAMLRLASWIASRYGAGLGEVLDAMLPLAVRTGGRRRRVRVVRLAIEREESEAAVESLEKRHPKQARTLRLLAEAGAPVPLRDLLRHAKVSISPVESLARKGLVRVTREEADPEPLDLGEVEAEESKVATEEQRRAVAAIVDRVGSGRSGAFLLYGVTGSGKTEVYLRALEACVAGGRQGIVLVPEIALTPQTVRRFRARFPRVAVLHSHLTDAERHEQWRAIQRGEADVVIGARSAVFAPTPRLGLLVVDEEHETTFKQQNAPRYDAREVARARCRFERAVLVLGSATPALETWHRARTGRLFELRLGERVAGGSFPETLVADLRQTLPVPGRPRCLTDRLLAALRECVDRGEQAILFLNRRGFATAAFCRGCGAAVECPRCDAKLVYHRRARRLICHLCGHEQRLPPQCPSCCSALRLAGFGTERIEEELRAALPEASIARMDSDTMRARGAHEEVLRRFREGRVDVLVGTQMIAKGLDFPNVTLVGIVSADHTLHIPDYRSAERTFDLIAQVAGRAGRSEKGGRVLVQTYDPDHFAIRLALVPDYERFAELELRAREKDGYPPFGHLARLVFQGPEEEAVLREAEFLRGQLGEWIVEREARLLGPAPCPIARLNGQFRYHIVLKARWRSLVRRFVGLVRARPAPTSRVRRLLDVDPLTML